MSDKEAFREYLEKKRKSDIKITLVVLAVIFIVISKYWNEITNFFTYLFYIAIATAVISLIGFIIIKYLEFKKTQRANSYNYNYSNDNYSSKEEPKAIKNKAYYCDILGLNENELTKSTLKQAYFKKMGEYHPDKVAALGDELRKLAEQKSKEINEAYESLKSYF